MTTSVFQLAEGKESMEEAYNYVPGSSPEMAHLSLATSINENLVTWSHGTE